MAGKIYLLKMTTQTIYYEGLLGNTHAGGEKQNLKDLFKVTSRYLEVYIARVRLLIDSAEADALAAEYL